MKKQRRWVVAGILTAVAVGVLVVGYFMLPGGSSPGDESYGTYQYHIAIISDETDTSFWQDVYGGAVSAGKKYGACVEQTGDGLMSPPSIEDAINIAIYENVDGILLRPVNEEAVASMINKACSRGIPVITMQKDVPDSKRQGFVGINYYFLGQEYGRQIFKLVDEDTRMVAVLFPGVSSDDPSRNWFRQGLNSTVQRDDIQFDFWFIQDDKGLNNAEDIIHDLMVGSGTHPDIILCLDQVITQSAYQLIRDLGLSDQVRIIGSYVSEEILNGIEQGGIDSTITVDPEAMGRMSVEALMTYKSYHMVSYYTEVDTRLIDKDSVVDYRREYRKGKENGEKAED